MKSETKENHSLKGLKKEVALREVPHKGLNHREGTSRVKRNSSEAKFGNQGLVRNEKQNSGKELT